MSRLNTKIRKLSDHLKYAYGINDGTNHPQCAETPDPIVKFANFKKIPIQNCASVYQMQPCTVISSLVIGGIQFSFIKVSRSSDPIYYLLCNQCEVHLSDKNNDISHRPQFIWPVCYWSILRCEDIHNHYFLSFFGKLFLWNGVNDGLMRLYSSFRHITTVFLSLSHNQYLWIELKTWKLVMKGLNLKNWLILLMFVICLFYQMFSVCGDAFSLFINFYMLIWILLYNYLFKNRTILLTMYQNYLK